MLYFLENPTMGRVLPSGLQKLARSVNLLKQTNSQIQEVLERYLEVLAMI
jgi:hypothetical protein